MTDKEKAEKYVNETFGRTNPIVAMTYTNIYLEGHEEGRKEGYAQGKETLLEMNEVLDSIDAKVQIKNFEKENAELKEKLKDAEKAQKQLTKAKEIIKEMLSILPKENIEGVYEISEYAEQFLNSEV